MFEFDVCLLRFNLKEIVILIGKVRSGIPGQFERGPVDRRRGEGQRQWVGEGTSVHFIYVQPSDGCAMSRSNEITKCPSDRAAVDIRLLEAGDAVDV